MADDDILSDDLGVRLSAYQRAIKNMQPPEAKKDTKKAAPKENQIDDDQVATEQTKAKIRKDKMKKLYPTVSQNNTAFDKQSNDFDAAMKKKGVEPTVADADKPKK